MSNNEIQAQKMFHEISEQLEALNREFSEFNAGEIGNIHTEKADEFRKKLLTLEKKANHYFEQFCYVKMSG
ncbi:MULTISPECIES: hypothetical protein [Vibrio]|uniref:hypothetical protein n=1 Tax=Vibrio TaxID=662 RepID=UPI0009291861|nr:MULTISPECIES: hypothetical protein [Vibrio]OJI53877.1 hypothetical protein VV1062A_02915 [Vibrio vulnificus]OJI54162.1 hypothetical protein VFL11327_04292 [Vibrio fluvialis]POB23574.1 hypothetical protein CRN47_14850 [Vibrio vulnificus]